MDFHFALTSPAIIEKHISAQDALESQYFFSLDFPVIRSRTRMDECFLSNFDISLDKCLHRANNSPFANGKPRRKTGDASVIKTPTIKLDTYDLSISPILDQPNTRKFLNT